MIGVIPGVLDPCRHDACRARIKFCRRPLPQSLMRALLVEVSSECIEPPLLVGRIRRWRSRGLLLQRAMHALVAPVLLRRGRANEVGFDPKLEPPGREFGQPARAT